MGKKADQSQGNGVASVSPGVVDPTPELKAIRLTMDSMAREFKGSVEHALTEAVSQSLRGQLAEQLGRQLNAEVERQLKTISGDLRAREERAERSADEARQAAIDASRRLSAISEEVLGERIRSAVEAATHGTAEEIFRREFDVRIEKLASLYDDLDDQFGQVRSYVKNFGPGGLPVLEQRIQEELKYREQLAGELEQIRGENRALREQNEVLEFARRRARAVEDLDPDELNRKLKEIDDKLLQLADRKALAAENQRLTSDLEKLRAELNTWLQRDLGVQQARADQQQLKRALEERKQADQAREEAEYHLDKVRDRERSLKAQVERLERSLREVEAEAAAAEERERRLEALTRELGELTKLYNGAQAELSELRGHSTALRSELGTALDARERAEAGLERARRDAKIALAREQEEERASERKRLDDWAEQEAALRASEHLARSNRLAEECDALRAKLEETRKDLREAGRLRVTLEQQGGELLAQCEALQRSADKHRSELEEEYQRREARRQEDLETERERVRALARAAGEEEEQAARARAEVLRTECERLEVKLETLRGELASLEGQRGALHQEIEGLERKLDGLTARDLDDEERLAELNRPLFTSDNLPELEAGVSDEARWLEDLERRIRESGFTFHPRLVRAFHTSLKIADHAPLMVLAGISGTGKSELPRLYADLGGLPFVELAVQPRWDSPDDLFGFFNYTDGRLKAEPLSRLLRQLSREGDPLGRGPTIVLLDEMNIARVEYYFSDLLSKLEARRNARRQGTEEARRRASVRLSAGASVGEVLLYPDERVLFVGTMNEDESTLTLSDKVLDRACVLTFPAPRGMSLTRQSDLRPSKTRLSWDSWTSWQPGSPSADISEVLNQVNDLMERVQRPFGHRLFRAMHAYIDAYPSSGEAARKDAISDQFAMKILPRLRGLECREQVVRRTLDDLRPQVPDDLRAGFDAAREREFFAWTGAADLYRVGGGA
jgi:chromosome segregation ATPase